MKDSAAPIRILVPLLQDYYIFNYLYSLIPVLTRRGMHVTVATFDKEVAARLARDCPAAKVISVPALLKFFNNRSTSLLFRSALWICGWAWGWWISRQFDFAIVPWTTKPLWHVISRCLPSLTCNNTVNFAYLELEAYEAHGGIATGNIADIGKFARVLERIGFLRPLRFAGRPLVTSRLNLLDRLLGGPNACRVSGFNGIAYLCVMGEQVKANYRQSGIDESQTSIMVTGNPNYENIVSIRDGFDAQARKNFLAAEELPSDCATYSLFLSPTRFTARQREEIFMVLRAIKSVDQHAFFVLKFHPKTESGELEQFDSMLAQWRNDIRYIRAFHGDDYNARLILSSKCILQKQSTVGYISFLLGMPIVSYDLVQTDHLDDMYERLGASFHCRSPEELVAALRHLETAEGRHDMADRQEIARQKFCVPLPSPCNAIADIVDRHFYPRRSAGSVRTNVTRPPEDKEFKVSR